MNTLLIPQSDRIEYKIDQMLRIAEERHDQAEINVDSEEYNQAQNKWLRFREAWQTLNYIFDANGEELIKAFCAPETQTELINITKKVYLIPADDPPPRKMKPYTLIIDPSAGSPSPSGSKTFVYEADTLKGAIEGLEELDLEFAPAKIYCATIGYRLEGGENRYETILRTDNGKNWYRDKKRYDDPHYYIPETWLQVHEWQDIQEFKVKKD